MGQQVAKTEIEEEDGVESAPELKQNLLEMTAKEACQWIKEELKILVEKHDDEETKGDRLPK